MPSSRSTRRKNGGLTRNAEDTTTVTTEPRSDPPAYEPIEGGDTDWHRHGGTLAHAHADPPHWHDGNQVVPLHDYPATADEAALYGPEPNPDNQLPSYEPPRLDGPHPIDPAESDAVVPPEQVDSSPLSTDVPRVDGVAAGRAVAEVERHTNGGNGLPTDPKERARLRTDLQASLDYLIATEPAPPPVPVVPVPPATTNRLGTVLGGLELVKASYRTMFAGATDGIDQEWALTMAASDLIGQMLDHHRRPAFADPGLIADLRIIAEQLDQAAAARTHT